jgi:O-antigen ligase
LPAVAGAGAMGLPLLLALAGVLAFRPAAIVQPFENKSLLLALLAAFAVWIALSGLWSPWVGLGWAKVPATLGFGLLFAAAAVDAPRLALSGAVAALIVLCVVLGIEALWGMPINAAAEPKLPLPELNKNPAKGVVVMLALLWPALAWLLAMRRPWSRVAAAMIALAAGWVSLQFGQLSTAFGFAIGLGCFALALQLPRLAILAPTAVLAIWMLASPLLTPILFSSPALVDALPHSSAARVGIWRYVCARIAEQPWIGHGLDAGRASTEFANYDGEIMRVIPVHPHSASLQIWYETGLIGALLASALIALTGRRLARMFAQDKLGAAAAAAVLAMFGFMANIGWSIWQEWWMATLILAGALIAALKAARA